MEKRCISCKRTVTNDGKAMAFSCPICGTEIDRCGNCRKTAVNYKCVKCSFEGP